MFLRKLMVIIVPLLLAGMLCVAFPLLAELELGFWTNVIFGFLLGGALALLLPLSGVAKRREPFAGLLWVPLAALVTVVTVQYLESRGIEVPVLGVFRTLQPSVVLVECAFIGYMLVAVIRTKK